LANQASNFVAQLLEYSQDERHAASVYGGLATAIDSLLEKDPDREVHIFGYSFGAVVAVDFLYPRASLHDTADRRIARAVRTLSTVGCPLDLVRLYMPDYLNGRQNLLPELVWRNVFIAADVMSSNFHDSDDSEEEPPDGLRFAGENRTSCRYTDHRLTVFNIFLRRGFISHRN